MLKGRLKGCMDSDKKSAGQGGDEVKILISDFREYWVLIGGFNKT